MKKYVIALACVFVVSLGGIAYYKRNAEEANPYKLVAKTETKVVDSKNLTEEKHIIFNTMPKSGSIYITKTLAQGLNLSIKSISPGYVPYDNISPEQLEKFYVGENSITQEHLNASVFNTQLLEKNNSKLILHLRDPRQACLSWVHNQKTHYNNKSYHLLYYVAPTAPIELYEQDLTTQIDWHIENYLPGLVKWMQDWFAYIDSRPENVKILVVTYEQFIKDKDRYLDKVLDFYDIPKESFKDVNIAKDSSSHFRHGDANEWQKVMTEAQINRCNEIVPAQLLERLSILNNNFMAE